MQTKSRPLCLDEWTEKITKTEWNLDNERKKNQETKINNEEKILTKNNTRERKLIDLPSVHTASCGTRSNSFFHIIWFSISIVSKKKETHSKSKNKPVIVLRLCHGHQELKSYEMKKIKFDWEFFGILHHSHSVSLQCKLKLGCHPIWQQKKRKNWSYFECITNVVKMIHCLIETNSFFLTHAMIRWVEREEI